MNKAKIKGWIVPIVALLCSIAFHFIATTPAIDTYISRFIQGEAVSHVKLMIELIVFRSLSQMVFLLYQEQIRRFH